MPDKKRAWKIYAIEDNGGDKKYWREVGCGFENEDGSYNLKLYMSPGLNLQLCPPKDN